MTAEYIEKLTTPPVIGRSYLVPCIWDNRDGWARRYPWWPVTGPLHDDADLGVPAPHWHYDSRFLSEEQLSWLVVYVQAQQLGMWVIARPEAATVIVHPSNGWDLPRHVLRVCEREALTFPVVSFLAQLEEQFGDARLKPDCRTCPHRGMPLGSLAANERGGIVCPGHGLQWHRDTGRLMPRRGGP